MAHSTYTPTLHGGGYNPIGIQLLSIGLYVLVINEGSNVGNSVNGHREVHLAY